jgi:hypothetical protein
MADPPSSDDAAQSSGGPPQRPSRGAMDRPDPARVSARTQPFGAPAVQTHGAVELPGQDGQAMVPPPTFRAIQTPGDLLPAVSGDGADSTGDRSASTAPPPAQHQPGEVIDGRYVLTRQLDEGGMGVVWLAHSLQLEVDVAVKLLPARRSGSVAAERMAREARAVAKLTHPAVVRVYDFGRTAHGDPYLAMELLQGKTLGRELDEHGPLEPVEAARLLLPIIDALATAHDYGIVHRDLKPDNIFLATVNGRICPKLLDFSLVKLVAPGFALSTLTRDGRGLGTLPYLSPEQVRGQSTIDRRADVWALCAVLYRATTGCVPFEGVGRYEVMRAVVEGHPTPTWKLGVGDKAFWRIIRRGLHKEPEERYASLRELGRELASWLLRHGVSEDTGNVSLRAMWLSDVPVAPSRRGRERLKSAARLALVAAAGLIAGVALTRWLDHRDSDARAAAPTGAAPAAAMPASRVAPAAVESTSSVEPVPRASAAPSR